MKYKNYTEKITRALKEYKEKIDIQEAMYVQEKKTIQAKAEEMKGQWTDEYIEKYLAENNPHSKYKKQMQDIRAIYEPTILHYLELIKKQLDGYFNAPVKTDFANKISAIKLSGLQLSDTEFQILQQSATSYLERRLLNQLAESRTKEMCIRDRSRKAWRAWCSTSWKWTGYIPRFPCLPQKNVR